MNAQWKPGDATKVAGMVALYVGSNRYAERWVFADGSQAHPADVPAGGPLVVIDPEDDEQIDRLTGLYCEAETLSGRVVIRSTARLRIQAALREYARPTPPRPEEPKNYLAVVEIAYGRRFWRWSAGDAHTSCPWRTLGAIHCDTEDDGNLRWDDLPVVEVISDGVEAS